MRMYVVLGLVMATCFGVWLGRDWIVDSVFLMKKDNLSIKVKDVYVSNENGRKRLIVDLRVTNQHKNRFEDWISRETPVVLYDEHGNDYPRILGMDLEAALGPEDPHRIEPGQTVEKIFVFKEPLKQSKDFTLTIQIQGYNTRKVRFSRPFKNQPPSIP